MPSPTTPLSVENEVMRGCGRGCRVDGDVQRARGHPGIAGGISCRGGQAVAAIRQDRRGVAPGPCSARQRTAEQRRTVIDLDRAVGLCRAGQRQRVVIGDAVADDAAVGRERGDAWVWSGPSCRWSRSARSRPPRYCRQHRLPWPSGCGRHSAGPPWCSSRPLSRSPARCRAASHRHRP